MASVLEMRAERARLIGQLRELIDNAETEQRDLSGEEVQTEERLNADIDALTGRIERQDRLDSLAAAEGRPEQPAPAGTIRRSGMSRDEFRAFFAGEAGRAHTFEKRDDPHHLNVGTAAEGGDLVDQEFMAQLYEELEEFSVIRQAGPTVITTGRGDELIIPKTDDFSSASIVGEGSTITRSNPTFEQVKIGAYKYATIVTASREFMQDTAVSDIVGFLAMQAGRALGDESGKHFVVGTGSGQPEGILEGATVGKTLAAKDAITADEIFDVFHSVIRPYRPRAAWLFHDSTVKAIRKLKDQDNQYLWQPGLQAGEPDRLLGRPVFTDVHVPEIGTDKEIGAFGDMTGYWVREVSSLEVVRSDEYLFDSDQIAWRFVLRTDGKLVDSSAIKSIKTASS